MKKLSVKRRLVVILHRKNICMYTFLRVFSVYVLVVEKICS